MKNKLSIFIFIIILSQVCNSQEKYNWKNIQKVELYSFEKNKNIEGYNSKNLDQKSLIKCKSEMIIPYLNELEKYKMDVVIEKKFYALRVFFPKSWTDFIYFPSQGVLFRMKNEEEYFAVIKKIEFNKLIEDFKKKK
jgi:hypothetical protein